MTRIGFVLLTHSNPKQILALTRALSLLYNDPPIACHHDFAQCPLDRHSFPKNVRFVEPHYRTFWGCFSIIPAALDGIRLLMGSKDAPDWFYLLSGSDYPSMHPERVMEMLSRTAHDGFIDFREISFGLRKSISAADELSGFGRGSYMALAYRRYCAVLVRRPSRKHPFAFPPEGRSYMYNPFWRTVFPGPFSASFRCYAGEHWFTGNGKVAEVLLSESGKVRRDRLLTHLQRRECPEECFYHSLLGNSGLNLSSNNLRYIDWSSSDAWHPKVLGEEDLPAILESGAHFARKVAMASPLQRSLDSSLGIPEIQLAAS